MSLVLYVRRIATFFCNISVSSIGQNIVHQPIQVNILKHTGGSFVVSIAPLSIAGIASMLQKEIIGNSVKLRCAEDNPPDTKQAFTFGMQKKPAFPELPGICYIPDRIEIAENEDLVIKLETEFADFVTCVADLLNLLFALKSKHLRSMTPMPHDVLRELKTGKGPLYKKFDRALGGPVAGISMSADNLFKRGMSVASNVGRKPAIKKDTAPKKRPLEADLIEIIGKKTKPIWHVVALEKPPDPLYDPAAELSPRDGPPHSPSRVLKKKDLPLSRTHSEEIIAAVRYLQMTTVKPSKPIFQEQMDMMVCTASGFSNVNDYKDYLETLKPHWFKDLCQSAVRTGLATSVEVIEAIEHLGQFYEMDSQFIPLAKAKMCLLVMSLPIWDIGRMPVQMAVNFILHDILGEPKSRELLKEWLVVRKLPYVVFAPVYSEGFLELVQPQKTVDGSKTENILKQ